MSKNKALELFEDIGMVKTGHFVLTSERHSDKYVDKGVLLRHPGNTSHCCRKIASGFQAEAINVVIGPESGGAKMAMWVAYHLNLMAKPALSIFAKKKNGGFIIEEGDREFIAGKRVLIVDDVATTGGSLLKTIKAVREMGGNIIGIGILCNRGGITAESLDVPILKALVDLDISTYEESECPLCEEEIPINPRPGHGREFLERQGRTRV